MGTEKQRDRAFSSYRAKRVDFAIIDRRGYPVVAIEYDGTGHKVGEHHEILREIKEDMLNFVDVPLIVVQEDEKISKYFDELSSLLRKK